MLNQKVKFKSAYDNDRQEAEKMIELLKPLNEEYKIQILMLIEGYSAGLHYAAKVLCNQQ